MNLFEQVGLNNSLKLTNISNRSLEYDWIEASNRMRDLRGKEINKFLLSKLCLCWVRIQAPAWDLLPLYFMHLHGLNQTLEDFNQFLIDWSSWWAFVSSPLTVVRNAQWCKNDQAIVKSFLNVCAFWLVVQEQSLIHNC